MFSNREKIVYRMAFITALLLLLTLVIPLRLYHLQITRNEELLAKAEEKTMQVTRLAGKRGEIFAFDGTPLVVNQPTVNVIVDPSLFSSRNVNPSGSGTENPPGKPSQRQQTAKLLADTLQMDYDDLYARFAPTRPRRNPDGSVMVDFDGKAVMRVSKYVLVKRNITLEQAAAIREAARQLKLRALTLEDTYTRFYPHGRMLASLLGYTDLVEDNLKATSGLEKSADAAISGTSGRAVREVSRDGRTLYYGTFEEKSVRDGKNIYLTIDPIVQSIVEEELDKAMAELDNPKSIYALMVDPATGNIIAAAQRPTFDPNDRSTMLGGMTSFRIGTDTMEPGSIIKPFTYARALDENLITPDSIEDTENGVWRYRSRRVVDTHEGLGKITIKEALRISSNIVPAKIAVNLLGDQAMYNNLYAFGFGQKTNLPIVAESRGLLRHYSKWDKQTCCSLGFGYALNVTPLQMVRAWCSLANDGKLVELRLIDRIEDPATGKISRLAVKPGRQMFSKPETAREIREMLSAVTTRGGTGEKAAIPGYKVAGKTGTSHKYDPETRSYSNRKYFGSFIGFAPADHPRFVLLVTVDEPPRSVRYGAQSAGPIFKAIGERTLKFYQVPPDFPDHKEKK